MLLFISCDFSKFRPALSQITLQKRITWFLNIAAAMCSRQSSFLRVMREVSGEFFVFQQDNAPAHRHATLCDLFFAVTGSLASKQPSEPEDRTVLPCSPEICRISLRHDSLARHRGSGKCTVNLRTYGQPSRCSSILKSDCEACWKWSRDNWLDMAYTFITAAVHQRRHRLTKWVNYRYSWAFLANNVLSRYRIIMRPSSLLGCIKCCTPSVYPSVRCLRFHRNRKAIETSNLMET